MGPLKPCAYFSERIYRNAMNRILINRVGMFQKISNRWLLIFFEFCCHLVQQEGE